MCVMAGPRSVDGLETTVRRRSWTCDRTRLVSPTGFSYLRILAQVRSVGIPLGSGPCLRIACRDASAARHAAWRVINVNMYVSSFDGERNLATS